MTEQTRRGLAPVFLILIGIIVLGGAGLVLRDELGGAPAPVSRFDPAKPYANTPAATWGEDVELPTPVAVGGFSAQQVGAAEAAAKQLLVAGHLDNRILVDHDPSTFLSLLAPTMQARVRDAINDPAHPDYGGMLTLLMSGYRLLPVPIRVEGSMTPKVGAAGNLVIHTNYVFAYPFAPADPSAIEYAWQVVAVVHVQADLETDNGLWISNTSAYVADESCSAAANGFLAPAYADESAPGAPTGTENPDAYFDPNHSMTIRDTCDR